MNTHAQLHSYLLIDGAQLAIVDLAVPTHEDPPGWLAHVYEPGAAAVSPLVIDIGAAYEAGGADQMTALFTALQPQLHACLIDTTLSHEALTQHLRHFIMVRTDTGKAMSLRFADCTVLPVLASVLTPAQWAALAGPIARWCVHGMDGALIALPQADLAFSPAATPLMLSHEQLAALAEACAPSVLLAYLVDNNHGDLLPGSLLEQHRWASAARQLWRAAGNTDEVVFRWLTEAALASKGAVLQQARLPALLRDPDQGAIRDGLLVAVSEHEASSQGKRERTNA